MESMGTRMIVEDRAGPHMGPLAGVVPGGREVKEVGVLTGAERTEARRKASKRADAWEEAIVVGEVVEAPVEVGGVAAVEARKVEAAKRAMMSFPVEGGSGRVWLLRSSSITVAVLMTAATAEVEFAAGREEGSAASCLVTAAREEIPREAMLAEFPPFASA